MSDEKDTISSNNDDVDMSFFKDPDLVKPDIVDDPEFKARLEKFAASLQGTSYTNVGYVDKNHYYITIS